MSRRITFVFLLLGMLQLALALESKSEESQAEEKEFSEYDDHEETPEDAAARSMWGAFFQGTVSLMKNHVHLNALSCNGPSCSSCIRANIPKILNKQGCFTITYNGQQHNAKLEFALNTENHKIWGTTVNAGHGVPSCINIKNPVGPLCIQDFSLKTSGQNGRPAGDLCFVISFRRYKLGARFCAKYVNNHLSPSVHPELIKA